jgi:TonB family protein
MRGLILPLFFLPVCALAQSLGTPAQMAQIPTDTGGVTCDPWYPAAERAQGVDGDTILSVRIAQDTTLHDPAVARSSGSDALDKAAMECLKHRALEHVTVAGSAADVTWQIAVAWRHDSSTFFNPPLASFDATLCAYPSLAVRLNHEGIVILSYNITADGGVRDVTVDQSSGHDELDATSASCAAARRYPPATVNGNPVQIGWKSRFIWRLASP